jgi:Z1 domain
MNNVFDISKFKGGKGPEKQYERQIHRLTKDGIQADAIETTIRGALNNLSSVGRKSFVIYGEPQSGKTEMMICLTAKLLDEGRKFILHLLNDSVDLLGQNLGRFQASGIAPSAQNFSEIVHPDIDIKAGNHIVFCKKNGSDLNKLINKIGKFPGIVIIDDEADFASPNAKVNKNEKTKINGLIDKLLGETGDYIGVTATPARLDLNNTFNNDSGSWVHFRPHPLYTGQEVFFPFTDLGPAANEKKFLLELLPDKGDDPKHARRAFLSFLVNVAYLNLVSNDKEQNYSILIHTSGNKADHKNDWGTIQAILTDLCNKDGKKFDKHVAEIWGIAHDRYPDTNPDGITHYIIDNISRNSIIILNSDRDFNLKGASATKPASLFTIIIGGNIVSRGVTFENLLSMFFTRDVKHKIQQDTYIQRARMFGSPGKYLKHFELTIPEHLYADWHRCFVFHRLSFASIQNNKGSPVWLSDSRISAVAAASIDRATVDVDRGEMGFATFNFDPALDELLKSNVSKSEKLDRLATALGGDAFPSHVLQFMKHSSADPNTALSFQTSSPVYKTMSEEERRAISRKKGLMGASQMTRSDGAVHFLKIFTNEWGMGRLFYKFDGSIQFIKNMK